MVFDDLSGAFRLKHRSARDGDLVSQAPFRGSIADGCQSSRGSVDFTVWSTVLDCYCNIGEIHGASPTLLIMRDRAPCCSTGSVCRLAPETYFRISIIACDAKPGPG